LDEKEGKEPLESKIYFVWSYSLFSLIVMLCSAQVKEEKAPKKPRKEAVPATNPATAPNATTATTTTAATTAAVAPGIAEIAPVGGGASETLSQTASPGLKIVLKPPKPPKNNTSATASAAVATKEEPAVAGGEKVPKKRGPKKKTAVPVVSGPNAAIEGSETASVNNNSVPEESIAL
jgi:cytoskeletal protein RodZ